MIRVDNSSTRTHKQLHRTLMYVGISSVDEHPKHPNTQTPKHPQEPAHSFLPEHPPTQCSVASVSALKRGRGRGRGGSMSMCIIPSRKALLRSQQEWKESDSAPRTLFSLLTS